VGPASIEAAKAVMSTIFELLFELFCGVFGLAKTARDASSPSFPVIPPRPRHGPIARGFPAIVRGEQNSKGANIK